MTDQPFDPEDVGAAPDTQEPSPADALQKPGAYVLSGSDAAARTHGRSSRLRQGRIWTRSPTRASMG